jgi:hypothetical protein
MARFYMYSPRADLFATGKHSIICECECEYLGGEGTSNTSPGFPTHEAPHPLMRSYSSRQERDNVECGIPYFLTGCWQSLVLLLLSNGP